MEEINRISQSVLSRPVVATGRGGSGTRLLSMVLQEHHLFLGNRLNKTQDSTEWAGLIFQLAIQKLVNKPPSHTHCQRELFARAERILDKGQWKEPQPWGWKLPETMLIVDEIAQALPGAKILHMVRHPVDTCLRRTHVTSRTSSRVGAATLAAAYSWLNWNRNPEDDEDYIRNAASWVYQVANVTEVGRKLGENRYLEIKYEELCTDSQAVSDTIASFLRLPFATTHIGKSIDHARRRLWSENDQRASEVWSICEQTAVTLGYRFPDQLK